MCHHPPITSHQPQTTNHFNVRLTEDDEEVALAGVLEVLGHVQVGVHTGLEHGDAAEFTELGGVRLVVEGAGDQNVEVRIARLARGGHQIGPGDGAEFRADEDGSPEFSGRRRVAVGLSLISDF